MPTQLLERDAFRFHVQTHGSGDPIVFLHAACLDSRMWAHQITEFSRTNLAIAYDQRGTGETDFPKSPYALHEDLLFILDALEVRTPVIVGSSLGARVAIDFAISYPDRVAALVLAGPGYSGIQLSEAYVSTMMPLIAAVCDGSVHERASDLLEASYLAVGRRNETVQRQLAQWFTENARIYGLDLSLWKELDPPAVGRLPEVSRPTLVIVGDREHPDIVTAARRIHEQVPNSVYEVARDAGHLPSLEHPDEFNTLVRQFISGLA